VLDSLNYSIADELIYSKEFVERIKFVCKAMEDKLRPPSDDKPHRRENSFEVVGLIP
jgi:hypothetical protein